jgi:hypothetical protein
MPRSSEWFSSRQAFPTKLVFAFLISSRASQAPSTSSSLIWTYYQHLKTTIHYGDPHYVTFFSIPLTNTINLSDFKLSRRQVYRSLPTGTLRSGRHWLEFQRCIPLPSSGRWMSISTRLKGATSQNTATFFLNSYASFNPLKPNGNYMYLQIKDE